MQTNTHICAISERGLTLIGCRSWTEEKAKTRAVFGLIRWQLVCLEAQICFDTRSHCRNYDNSSFLRCKSEAVLLHWLWASRGYRLLYRDEYELNVISTFSEVLGKLAPIHIGFLCHWSAENSRTSVWAVREAGEARGLNKHLNKTYRTLFTTLLVVDPTSFCTNAPAPLF